MSPPVQTHPRISHALCGAPGELSPGRATATLQTTEAMRVDDAGLVHGGFVFGLVDHAAMLAVNDPLVVLGSADCRFVAPVRVGDVVHATAQVEAERGKKRTVSVEARVDQTTVLTGTLQCFVLTEHVLGARKEA